MSMYEEFIRDFVERTNVNLDAVRNQKNDLNDVTQLINSLLGLIVFINEEKIQSNRANIFRENVESFMGELIILKPQSSYKIPNSEIDEPNTMSYFLRHMRNAIAHCRIEPQGDKTIESIEFSDNRKRKNTDVESWTVTLTVEQLYVFTRKFTSAYLLDDRRKDD